MTQALVIGAGPAGLMAAETMASAGLSVTIVDAMPSVGRKFLMAGKSGLNLTKNEDDAAFLAAFGECPAVLQDALLDFGPTQVMAWAEGLGQPLFTGSTGRVFPTVMKASPLLRAWLARLERLGVTLHTKWRWTGWDGDSATFETPDGPAMFQADRTVLGLGGASWARLGSDGAWAELMPDVVAPFKPANMGFVVAWSDHMAKHFGQPIKSVALTAGDLRSRGEIILSEQGLEGGGIYAVSRALRDGATLKIDLMPDWTAQQIDDALAKPKGKTTLTNHLRKTLRLDPQRIALLLEWARPLPDQLSHVIKALEAPLVGPRPRDQAISTAGGVKFSCLDGLMLKSRKDVYVAGEMLDWEAPTGGYLITGCLATGRAAGLAAAG